MPHLVATGGIRGRGASRETGGQWQGHGKPRWARDWWVAMRETCILHA